MHVTFSVIYCSLYHSQLLNKMASYTGRSTRIAIGYDNNLIAARVEAGGGTLVCQNEDH
jgi:hypothetical protein